MPIVTTSAKGQVVIPASIRAAVGLEPGQKVVVEIRDNKEIVIRPLSKNPIAELYGSCKSRRSMTKALEKERRKDARREEERTTRRVGNASVSSR